MVVISLIFLLKLKNAPIRAQVSHPNIVVIMTDDQDTDSMPAMRKLLSYPEGSWINFKNAFANDSICCPARSTVLSGQYSHTTGVTGNNQGAAFKDGNTLPVWLDNAGYRTGLIGKYLNGYPWTKGTGYVPPGWDYFKESKTISGKNTDTYSDLAVDFVNTSTTPFFLYLAYNAPHYPATVPTRYANTDVYVPPHSPNFNEADVSDKPKWVKKLPLLTSTNIQTWDKERVASQKEIMAIDDGVQRVVDTLKAKGQLDNTMIIFLADHGYSWGSHRYYHKHCEFEECSRMPLLIRYPGLTANRDETRLVSNVSIAGAIAEYAGVTPGLTQETNSLIPLLTNTATSWNEDLLLEYNGTGSRSFWGIRAPGWKYIEYTKTGEKGLYDLTNDPYELENRANQSAYTTTQADLASRLRTLRGL